MKEHVTANQEKFFKVLAFLMIYLGEAKIIKVFVY